MEPSRILGLVLLGVGVILLVVGVRSSEAPLDQLSSALTGRFTDRTIWYLVGGAAAAIGGGLLFLFGRKG